MDFSPTEAQQDLAALTRQILANPTHWVDLAKAGVLSAALPEDVGGAGFGLLEQCAVLVEVGRAVSPVPYLPSIVVAASALARFGTPEQREKWAAPAGAGEVVLTAALDDEVATVAERVPGGWLLNGTKTTVPAGTTADLFLIPATTPTGPAVFLVEPQEVAITPQRVVDSDDAAWLDLDGVLVGDDRLLPGADVVDWLTTRATVGLCALQLGVTERALELTAEYASTRVQFERPIGSFQAVAQRLADAYIDVAAIRLTLWQAAWRLESDLPCAAEVATAKFWAADGGHRVAHTAVHVHGGMGIDVEHDLHRYFLAAKRNEFTLGGATTHLLRLGDTLLS